MTRRAARRTSSRAVSASRPQGRRGRIAKADAPSTPTDASRRLAISRASLATGLAACAKHAPSLAAEAFAIAAAIDDPHAELARPRPAGRLRWEWLASTGTQLDGSPDARLLAECAGVADRIFEDFDRLAPAESAGFTAVREAAIRVHLLASRRTRLGMPV